jgi:hypothetical protein
MTREEIAEFERLMKAKKLEDMRAHKKQFEQAKREAKRQAQQ